jgi:hypothetical protein
MRAVVDHLCATGYAVPENDLEHLSPILSGHINLHGSHHFDLQAPKKRQGQLRSLRTTESLFRHLAYRCSLDSLSRILSSWR